MLPKQKKKHKKNVLFVQTTTKNQYDGLTERSSNFVDFGHGSGKALLTACLSGRFEKCIGVELLQNLYNQSVEIKSEYDKFASGDPDKNIMSS